MAYTTIDKPSDYFETKLYTGNGGTQSITGLDFAPSWVWIKRRSSTQKHGLYDTVRGATKVLASDATDAEATHDALTAFGTDGFTLGNIGRTNTNNETYVAWSWKETATAGFDIVAYTGTGSSNAVSHSLSATPNMMIIKNRDDTDSWYVWHQSLGAVASNYINLDTVDPASSVDNGIIALSSSNFTVNTRGDVNENTMKYIAYCFAEKKGYSKFGSYTGNGNADGTFVYTGFKPAFVIVKNTSINENWSMHDHKRNDAVIPNFARLTPDDNQAEAANTTFAKVELLSNGFKLGGTADVINDASVKFIFMAFAENPFVTSGGVPATAR